MGPGHHSADKQEAQTLLKANPLGPADAEAGGTAGLGSAGSEAWPAGGMVPPAMSGRMEKQRGERLALDMLV